VKGLDLRIERGQIAALLGPNGAGKTTTMEIIEGLKPFDSGQVLVLGMSPLQARRRVGVQLQEGALYDDLTCAETIRLFGRLYGFDTDPVRLLRLVDLEEMLNRRASALSGGQKRRLQIALTLCNDPELVVLDEPTTGLDPLSRRQTWSLIEELHGQGRTVLLTTHYIEEAEQLAELVVIIDHGRVVPRERRRSWWRSSARLRRSAWRRPRSPTWLGFLESFEGSGARDAGSCRPRRWARSWPPSAGSWGRRRSVT